MTGSRGPRGYPDYQRVENYDGEQILKERELKTFKGVVTGIGPFDVSRYAAIKVRAECITGAGILKLSYGTEEGGAAFIGKKEIVMTSTTGATAVLEIQNLGPELTVEWEALTEPGTVKVTVVPTNRNIVQMAVPSQDVLLHIQPKLKAKSFTEFPVTPLATGTGHLTIESGTPAGVFGRILGILEPGKFVLLGGLSMEAGHDIASVEALIPPIPIVIGITNGELEQELVATFTVG